jgi:type VI secretion system secreted protein Hcp
MTTAIRMTIRLNGEAVEGEGVSHHESGFIDCLGFTDGITTDQAPTGRSLGRRHPEPIVVTKRIDRTTPRLLEALSQNEQVDATFTFHRPTPEGADEHYFTVDVTGGRIVGIERSWQADAASEREDVRIAPIAVTWTHVLSGSSYESRPRGMV